MLAMGCPSRYLARQMTHAGYAREWALLQSMADVFTRCAEPYVYMCCMLKLHSVRCRSVNDVTQAAFTVLDGARCNIDTAV